MKNLLINPQICECGVEERKDLVRTHHLNGQRHTHGNVLLHFTPYDHSVSWRRFLSVLSSTLRRVIPLLPRLLAFTECLTRFWSPFTAVLLCTDSSVCRFVGSRSLSWRSWVLSVKYVRVWRLGDLGEILKHVCNVELACEVERAVGHTALKVQSVIVDACCRSDAGLVLIPAGLLHNKIMRFSNEALIASWSRLYCHDPTQRL